MLVLGLLVLAASLVAGMPGDDAAEASRKAGSAKLIVAPRHGSIHKPGPFYAVVRARPRDRVRVSLNGVASSGGWSRIRNRRLRKLRISPDHGLRHGRNVLRVSVRRRGAKRARAQTVTFRIAGRAPLAAAGRDRRIAAGSRIRLDASASRLHPSVRRAGGELRHRWRLLRVPRGSGLARRIKRANASAKQPALVVHRGPRALFEGTDSPVPHFRPDAPGTYKLGLEATGPQGTSSRDEIVLRVEPDPMVQIETMAKPQGQKSWGVRVGEQFYPDPGDSKKWLQVVVLSSDKLELVSNKAYDCPAATSHPRPSETSAVASCTRELEKDLAALKTSGRKYVVIAVSQRPSGRLERTPAWQVQPPVGARDALFAIAGVGTPYRNGGAGMLRGRMSVIGSFGGVRKIVVHDNPDLEFLLDDGDIVGGLLRDNKGEYSSYASFEHLPYDTQAPGSDAATNVMRVGGEEYKQPVSNRGGFHVVVVEPEDLGGRSYWFNTGNQVSSAEQLAAVRGMRDALAGIPSWAPNGALVFIASRGDARLAMPDGQSTQEVDNVVQELVNLLAERFGATRNRAYRALDPVLGDADQAWGKGERSYTLVAEYGTPPGEGLEAEEPQRPLAGGLALNAAPFAGTITRGSNHGFEFEASEEGEALGGAGVKLRDTAFSAIGDWPEKGDVNRTAAIAWIAGQTDLDTRRAYLWSRGTNFDWAPLKKEIEGLSYPKTEVGFKEADLSWAKRELVEEIDWLITARGYVADLAEPFVNSQLQGWAAFEKIAGDINLKVKAPPEDKTAAKALIIFDAVREAASEIPGAGEIVGVVNVIYDSAIEWSKIDNQGTEADEPFAVKAGDLGAELAKRMKVVQETLSNQMLQVIAADYRKLRTVGLCAGNVKACPDGPVSEWQLLPKDQQRISEAVEIGVKRLVYTALFPAKYTAWKPPLAPWRSVNWQEHQPAGETFPAVWFCPFHDLPASAQLSFPLRRVVGSKGGGGDTWQVVAYAERTGAGALVNPYAMNLPDASVTDPLVKSVAEGGLGFGAEDFYLDAYTAGGAGRTMPFQATGVTSDSEYAFPLQDSPTQWINKTEPVGVRTAGCGYG
ncbi:MAG: hypothetical protein WD810_03120 [Solirubrobacterales bacterium]